MSRRRTHRSDANQPEIVDTLRTMGCTVQDLSNVGKGCPDLLIGLCGQNFLIEVKDGKKPPSKQKLTVDQIQWHDEWRGQAQVINSVDKAIAFVNYVRNNKQSSGG